MDTRALNRALLARQHLLDRADTLIGGVEQIAGIQAQYAPSIYIGLWSRVRDLTRDDVTSALEDGRLVQATLMRATIHVVSARDHDLFAAAVRRCRRAWWRRVQPLGDLDMDAVAKRVRALLAGGPMRARDIQAALEADGWPKLAWSSVGMWVDLVRVPPSGTWVRRRADLYGLAPETELTEDEGLEHLVTRYLGAFGPATLGDLVSWAQIPPTVLGPVVERLDLRRFGELLDVPDGLLPRPGTPVPPRFLPTWDATLLVHARRTQILPEAYRNRIFHTKNPQSVNTFLVDGAVAGTWRFEQGEVRVEPFEGPVPSEVREEADRLARFLR